MTGLLEGRPEDCSGRLPKEIKTYDCLDALDISYGQVDHEPLMTMEACAEADRIVGHDYIAVTLTGED